MENIDHDRIVKAYWDLWEQARTDPEYARLRAELEAMEPGYEALLLSLPDQDRLTLDRYITLRESMNRRMLEISCEGLMSST